MHSRLYCIFREHTLYNCICHNPPKKHLGKANCTNCLDLPCAGALCGVGIIPLPGRTLVEEAGHRFLLLHFFHPLHLLCHSDQPLLAFRTLSFALQHHASEKCRRIRGLFFRRQTPLASSLAKTERRFPTIPSHRPFVHALISTEDERFYSHHGVDFVGAAGAMKDALRGHARGASTISQQLVKNMFRVRTEYSTGLLGYIPGVKILIMKLKE